MVTRLPGTFGSACEEIGSTTAEIASIVDGKALPITKAQARPAMMARWNGRGCISIDDLSVTDIESSIIFARCLHRHCEERSDEAIHSFFLLRDGLLRCA